ncbi:hypothetical protein KVT40_002852 [Elsinoe batatas]|uniref:Tse2 ADP-ribosyltransferase toxin domain-containing protein n=1 Tax=Elsinoe batatas TaxID=2601811 RepID=A0A8K0L4G8_9PEZI|nr:hypothetical protein KVT40_002852 [Elsinoe batatas]
MNHNRFLASFAIVPKTLFRTNKGSSIRLRAHPGPLRPRGPFDLLTTSGLVKPKALDPKTYEFPNGASMRSNSPAQRRVLATFTGPDVIVYEVPKGTILPKELILVHEFRDHYSLQAAREMTVRELNDHLTVFFGQYAIAHTKKEWYARFPVPTE